MTGWRNLIKTATRVAAVVLVGVLLAEAIARLAIGLGDPPLYVSDPEIEYLFAPNQECYRFGNRIAYNRFSMRSPDFGVAKQSPQELRVLLIGDSVINGGTLTDQNELASTLLSQRLQADLKRPVMVANISAGSWGPGNQLAYLRRFGLFSADLAVVVVSSHDLEDARTFRRVVGVDPNFPARRPWSATAELATRYAWPRLRRALGDVPAMSAAAPQEDAFAKLGELIELIRAEGIPVILATHWTRSELQSGCDPFLELNEAFGHLEGVTLTSFGPSFQSAVRGSSPYRDDIHPNARGQSLIAAHLGDMICGIVDWCLASRHEALGRERSARK